MSHDDSFALPRPADDLDEDDDEFEADLLLPSTLAREQELRVVLRLTSFGDDEVDHVCYYYIQVCAETMHSRVWCVRKRYSQFHALRKELKRIVKDPPPLPGKEVMKRFLGVQDLRKRANGLSTFLWRIAGDPILCNSQPVRRFLGTDVVESPPANAHPTTPLLSSFRGIRSESSAAAMSNSFVLDAGGGVGGSSSAVGLKTTATSMFASQTREGEGTAAMDDSMSEDGRLFLGKLSSVDALAKGFAEEGLAFSEADMHEPESEEISLDDDHDDGRPHRRSSTATGSSAPRTVVPQPLGSAGAKKRLDASSSPEPFCSLSFFGFGTKSRPSGASSSVSSASDSLAEEQVRLLQQNPYSLSSASALEISAAAGGAKISIDNHGEEEEMMSSRKAAEVPLADLPIPVDPFPSLRVVILLVGSRGDVQPYVALGKAMKARGHMVRIAAHECFREWIEQKHGLQFAPIAGDPKELLKMVVENKMFSYEFVKNGVTNHRAWVSQVLIDCWHACTLEDPNHPSLRRDSSLCLSGSRPPSLERRNSDLVGPGHAFNAMGSKFRADLIIANPPSFAGWHCAEALGVPLMMSFPMPWSRTTEFPSPFTSLSALSSPASLNWMSYGAVDRLIWLGLGDLINAFRVQTLWLHPIWTLSVKGHRYVHDYRVPFLYCWSPSVLAKPKDWGPHIAVSGYLFLDDSDGKDWQPNETLIKCFGDGTKKVVFIGFGSIVVKDPENLSLLVLAAARVLIERGFHVLVQKGWAGVDLPEEQGLFLVGAAPHSWIFPRCAAVVHHGGSGTTAEGLKNGIPTVVVPFFGDQFFWGETVKRRGLGDCEPYASLTANRLVECILTAVNPDVKKNCAEVSAGIKHEDGAQTACDFIEKVVFGFDGFDAIVMNTSQHGDWRRYPYYDLKKRVKLERYQNVKGLRKIKSRINKIASTISSSSNLLLSSATKGYLGGDAGDGDLQGVEMKPMRAISTGSTQSTTSFVSETGSIANLSMQRSASGGSASSSRASSSTNLPGLVAASSAAPSAALMSFPFLPEMYPGRVPQGHTAYSWFGKRTDERGDPFVPFGHTKFSWSASTW